MGYLGTPIDTNNTFQSLQGKRFSGNGSTTAFTLDVAPTSTFDIEVFVENVRQDPNSAYSLSGTTLTFAAAPGSGTNNIYVIHQAKAVGTISAGEGTVQASSFSNDVISGHTALAAEPADTDEFLVSDAGTIKRIDYSLIKGSSNTPAFSTVSQTLSNETYTKVDFDTENFDTDGAYDHSTNQRFTVPSGKAGKYLFNCFLIVDAASAAQLQNCQLAFYKNNSLFKKTDWSFNSNDILYAGLTLSSLMDLSATDYIEVYVRISDASGSPVIDGSATTLSEFSGFKLI